MKSILGGSIFLALLLGAVTYMRLRDDGPRKLRVAFPAARPALSYEPTDIHLDFEYILLENLYSPLVEFDAHGAIQPGVAGEVDTTGRQVRLTVRPNLKTQSGIRITAEDIVFSLKRLLVLSGNTHGNFRDLICPGLTLKSVEDPCPGISVQGDSVILSAGDRHPFIVPMLAAIDFAIVPRSSVDPKTLKITNMRETSGPYFVDSDDGNGHIKLRANPNHYHFAKDIPTEIDFVPMVSSTKGESLQALLDKKIDHVMTVDTSRSDEVLSFINSHSDFSVHTTQKIRTIVLIFTELGQKKFSTEQRRLIGSKIRETFRAIYEGVPGMEARDEFIPGLGDGSLEPAQHAALEQLNKNVAKEIPSNIKIGLLKRSDTETWSRPLSKALPTVEFYKETDVPDLKKNIDPSKEPDAFICATDTGFMEDISLISYSLNAGLLGLEKRDRQKWLADYMATEKKSDRMNLLRQLHYNALASPVTVPLMASPYTALVRNSWRMELSQLYANNQLWRIKHQ
jgi:hypothetical protein